MPCLIYWTQCKQQCHTLRSSVHWIQAGFELRSLKSQATHSFIWATELRYICLFCDFEFQVNLIQKVFLKKWFCVNQLLSPFYNNAPYLFTALKETMSWIFDNFSIGLTPFGRDRR